jgi:hypothetical protein
LRAKLGRTATIQLEGTIARLKRRFYQQTCQNGRIVTKGLPPVAKINVTPDYGLYIALPNCGNFQKKLCGGGDIVTCLDQSLIIIGVLRDRRL